MLGMFYGSLSYDWLERDRDRDRENLGIARWKRGIGQDMGKGLRASTHSLRVPVSPHLHTFTNLEAL